MALADRVFGRSLGSEERALKTEISALINETPENSLALFPPWEEQPEVRNLQPLQVTSSEPTIWTFWS